MLALSNLNGFSLYLSQYESQNDEWVGLSLYSPDGQLLAQEASNLGNQEEFGLGGSRNLNQEAEVYFQEYLSLFNEGVEVLLEELS